MDNKELLERDRYYLEKAANVTPEERKMVEESLARGEQVYPELYWIYCPIWRIRVIKLEKEGIPASEILRQIIFGLNDKRG